MREKHPSWLRLLYVFLSLGALAVAGAYVVNVFLRYQDYRSERIPDVRASIRALYPAGFGESNRFAYIVDMQVYNYGAPSWVSAWKCRATLQNGDIIESIPAHGRGFET